MHKLKFAGLSLLAALMLPGHAVTAQSLPKNIRIVVPYPAGGAGDVLARVIAQSISEKNGITIIIEDRPGAGSIVGTEFASRATPDGTTLLLVENPFVLSAVLHSVRYNPVTSFQPICYVADTPAVLAVNGTSDIHTLADLLRVAKTKPGAVTYGSTGPASIVHIAGELLRRDSGTDMTYVPYPGSPPAMNAVLSGHVTAVIANYSDLRAQLNAGALRPIAIPASKRVQSLPDVPTLDELGYKNIEATVWFGFVAPKGTPQALMSELAKQFSAAMEIPAIKDKVIGLGLFPSVSCGAPFGAFIATQQTKYTEFVQEFGIKSE